MADSLTNLFQPTFLNPLVSAHMNRHSSHIAQELTRYEGQECSFEEARARAVQALEAALALVSDVSIAAYQSSDCWVLC